MSWLGGRGPVQLQLSHSPPPPHTHTHTHTHACLPPLSVSDTCAVLPPLHPAWPGAVPAQTAHTAVRTPPAHAHGFGVQGTGFRDVRVFKEGVAYTQSPRTLPPPPPCPMPRLLTICRCSSCLATASAARCALCSCSCLHMHHQFASYCQEHMHEHMEYLLVMMPNQPTKPTKPTNQTNQTIPASPASHPPIHPP